MQVKGAQEIGKVIVSIKVANRKDELLAEEGFLAEEQVRSTTVENVLVDTSATTLCLPKNIIAELGLKVQKAVDVMTAMGIGKARIYRDVSVSICGREGTFECLELPQGQNALLGVIPLEAPGIKIDLKNQALKVLPTESADTYLTIL
ncbi:MAG: aspartyl protease [Leptolyngbya sp. Prado105]|jgi:predicted aspartyl protease|nr:aspartyl protease [Leptolyngbya sp. Prado105]